MVQLAGGELWRCHVDHIRKGSEQPNTDTVVEKPMDESDEFTPLLPGSQANVGPELSTQPGSVENLVKPNVQVFNEQDSRPMSLSSSNAIRYLSRHRKQPNRL